MEKLNSEMEAFNCEYTEKKEGKEKKNLTAAAWILFTEKLEWYFNLRYSEV